MNTILATTVSIECFEGISSIIFETRGATLTMLGLEPPEGLEEGCKVELGIKSTHITIASKIPDGMAISNIIPVTLTDIDNGKIVSLLKMDFEGLELEAILPTEIIEPIAPKKGDNVLAVFQASELFIHRIMP